MITPFIPFVVTVLPLTSGKVTPAKLGSGGTGGGGKLLRDDSTYAPVRAAQINSGAATNGQVIKANGSGGAAWGDL